MNPVSNLVTTAMLDSSAFTRFTVTTGPVPVQLTQVVMTNGNFQFSLHVHRRAHQHRPVQNQPWERHLAPVHEHRWRRHLKKALWCLRPRHRSASSALTPNKRFWECADMSPKGACDLEVRVKPALFTSRGLRQQSPRLARLRESLPWVNHPKFCNLEGGCGGLTRSPATTLRGPRIKRGTQGSTADGATLGCVSSNLFEVFRTGPLGSWPSLQITLPQKEFSGAAAAVGLFWRRENHFLERQRHPRGVAQKLPRLSRRGSSGHPLPAGNQGKSG